MNLDNAYIHIYGMRQLKEIKVQQYEHTNISKENQNPPKILLNTHTN